MKIVIIGCSIAGASAALALSGNASISVYEKKSRQDVPKKICANVVTYSFLKYCRELGLKPENFLVSRFTKAFFLSRKNDLFLPTKEFRIDRAKFLDSAIKNAQKKGAKFNYNAEFVSFRKEKGKFIIKLKKGNKEIIEKADILIGADGALSRVSENAGIKGKKFWLCMHTEIPASRIKFNFEKDAYYLFLERRFGYYAYIFPFKDKVIVGSGDFIEKAEKNYQNFLKFLRIKPAKTEAALISFPKNVHNTKNMFLIGDAACSTKFSGGGIVPAIMDAIAARNIIVHKNLGHYKIAKKRIRLNILVAKILSRLSDKEFDGLLKVLKHEKFASILEKRDEFERKEYLKMFDLRLLKYLIKAV